MVLELAGSVRRLDVRVSENGDEVVGRRLAPLGDQPRHVLGHLDVRAHARHRLPFVDVEQLVGGLADHLLVLLGHAEQRPDDHHRELHPEVLHEVEPAGADERVEEVGAQLADAWLEV